MEPVLTGPITPGVRGWRALAAPKSGWAAFWRQADERGLSTLPDESSLPGKGAAVDDGILVLVEAAAVGRYRYYSYYVPEDNPQWAEAGGWSGC